MTRGIFRGLILVAPLWAVVILLVLLLSACHPTSHPRCDDALSRQKAHIEAQGWHLRCDPPDHDPRYTDRGQMGQAGPDNTVWLWPDRIAQLDSERLLRKIAWHEAGHVAHIKRGITFTSSSERERWADAWAWCKDPIAGVGYYAIPSDCAPYR